MDKLLDWSVRLGVLVNSTEKFFRKYAEKEIKFCNELLNKDFGKELDLKGWVGDTPNLDELVDKGCKVVSFVELTNPLINHLKTIFFIWFIGFLVVAGNQGAVNITTFDGFVEFVFLLLLLAVMSANLTLILVRFSRFFYEPKDLRDLFGVDAQLPFKWSLELYKTLKHLPLTKFIRLMVMFNLYVFFHCVLCLILRVLSIGLIVYLVWLGVNWITPNFANTLTEHILIAFVIYIVWLIVKSSSGFFYYVVKFLHKKEIKEQSI